jgi:hypothetical protein
MNDSNVKDILDDQISLDQLDETDHSDTHVQTPAMQDESSASGHTPDLESDDDIDEMGAVVYGEKEELGIDSKVTVVTESEPPVEDTPY